MAIDAARQNNLDQMHCLDIHSDKVSCERPNPCLKTA